MKLMRFSLLLISSLFFFSCNKDNTIGNMLNEILKKREGSPILFQLGEQKFSLNRFREELRFRRIVLENKNPLLSNTEVESYLNTYIEETVLLKQAEEEIDFNSVDFKEYITPYLSKGVIDYYLFEKSGGMSDYRNYNYDSEILKELEAKGIIKEKMSKNEEKMLNELIVWRRLALKSKKREEDTRLLLAKLKTKNKVIIYPINK